MRALLLAATLFGALPAFAADAPPPPADMSCAYFSPNPDDVDGPPIHFYGNLSPDEESWVVDSHGKGRIDFTLDRKTLKLTWHLTFEGLTSPATGAHIHGPGTAGGEAGVLIDLAPKGVKSPVDGEATLNEGLLVYLVQDRMYVNLKTTKYPMGELRAPVKKARPQCGSAKP